MLGKSRRLRTKKPRAPSATTSSARSSSASHSRAWSAPRSPAAPSTPSAPPPTFRRRRFRSVHPPPLLGSFFDPDGPAISSFAPLRRRSDPDLAAAVRGADFFLTRLPDADDAAPGWEIRYCHGGYVLHQLGRRPRRRLQPSRAPWICFPRRPEETADDCAGYFTYLDYHVVAFDEEPGAFRVVCTSHDESRDARRRLLLLRRQLQQGVADPAVGAAGRRGAAGGREVLAPLRELVGESIYWTHTSKACMLVLDTAAMRFSRIDIPSGKAHVQAREHKDGKPCIVCAMEFTLLVWYREVDVDDGVDKWMLDKMYHLQTEIVQATQGLLEYHGAIKVLEIMEGIVYLSTSETFNDPNFLCWFLTFCLETGGADEAVSEEI
ncbi:hypothetical protein U9M48_004818 [Paspalum notatum var. saurae]|uniref:Uncharacterized protein n=1 Tax=Paspalum notatum var. saurae TaxID=547442 RepID=A0AAQ3SF32_PASNO